MVFYYEANQKIRKKVDDTKIFAKIWKSFKNCKNFQKKRQDKNLAPFESFLLVFFFGCFPFVKVKKYRSEREYNKYQRQSRNKHKAKDLKNNFHYYLQQVDSH